MNSYIVVDALKVRDACNQYLQLREKRIEKRKQVFIDNTVARRKGWFSSQTYTLDEAEALWTTPGDLNWSPEDRAKNEGGYWTSKAKDLKSMAEVAIKQCSNRVVYLNLEDASFLERYFE